VGSRLVHARRRAGRAALFLALLSSPLLAARAPGPPGPPLAETLVVGSKNFTESHLLGELLCLVLESEGYAVEHRSGLGGTTVCYEALLAGAIDMYPEYTGTVWAILLKEPERIADPLRAYAHVQRRLRERDDLEVLSPFGLENSYALAMREERAAELGVASLGDLAAVAGSLRAGFSHEFLDREDGYPGLAEFYGLEFREHVGMEHSLAYAALAGGTVDVIDAYTTDGKLARYDLRVLEDDAGFFPPYHAIPIVRGELLRTRPGVRACVERLAFALTDRRTAELNLAVEENGGRFREVARGFLRAEGLLDADGRPGAAALGGVSERRGFWDFFLARRGVTARLLLEHLWLTLLSVVTAAAVAIPLGVWATRNAFVARVSLAVAGAAQTIPSLALLATLLTVPFLGLSVQSAIAALVLYALLPMLRNTYTGIREVDPDLIDAALGMGLTRGQILRHVELPLATRTILAGVRTATVICVGVATLAAFIGQGGLGEPIVTGLYLNDTRLILSGALPAAALALAADALLGLVEKRVTPRGLRLAEE